MRTLQMAIEAQRDTGSPNGERFVGCADEDADQFAVITTGGGAVTDFATRAEAEVFADDLTRMRAGDIFETRDGWHVVVCVVPFTFDGPMTEAEAQKHGDGFAD